MAEQELRTNLTIEKFPHGGFGVRDLHQEGRFAPQSYLFACDSVDTALAWMRQAMVPQPKEIVGDPDLRPGAIDHVG